MMTEEVDRPPVSAAQDAKPDDAAHERRTEAGAGRRAEDSAGARASREGADHLDVIREELENDRRTEANVAEGRPIIRLEDVHLAFDLPVLDGVSLEVRERETLMVAGESGTGKSTILKLILRLLVPESGSVCVFDQEVQDLTFKEALDLRRRIGMVFQNSALFDSLSVFENVAYPLRERNDHLSEEDIRDAVHQRLEFVDLNPAQVDDQLPSQLSGGMKKRVGVARAIITDPEVVLYDEPTAGLDPLTIGKFNDLVRKLQRELGVTSVLVTHDIRTGFRVASRVNLLREGRIVFDGTPEEMVAADDPYIKRFLG
ncbi:MAG: ATP-binding cassette domain-containing protein [Gemmatimonadota bacterium]